MNFKKLNLTNFLIFTYLLLLVAGSDIVKEKMGVTDIFFEIERLLKR